MNEITGYQKLIDLNDTCNKNAKIAKVNIGFDCENSILFENLINLNRTYNQKAEIVREDIGFHYE